MTHLRLNGNLAAQQLHSFLNAHQPKTPPLSQLIETADHLETLSVVLNDEMNQV